MKKNILYVLSTALVVAALFSNSYAQLAVKASGNKTFTLSDKVGKNQFEWISEAPLEKINGTAEGIEGAITFDPKKPNTIKATISAQVSTMRTGNDMRDGHVKSATWLDAEKYPKIIFTATSIKNVKANGNTLTADVIGDFSMHGITKKLTVPMSLHYMDASPKTSERAPGDLVMINSTFTVSLKDFKVEGSKGTIGNKVGETITINAKLFGASGL